MMGRPDGTKSSSVVRRLWERWKQVAKRIGDIQARVLLSFFYFIVLNPFALAMRWRMDPLAIKAGTPRGWQLKSHREGTPMELARRQF